jgi:hypothetical protein
LIALVAFAFSRARKKAEIFFFIKHAATAFFLTAFWTIPLLAKSSFSRSTQYGYGYTYIPLIIFPVGIYLFYLIYKNKKEILPYVAFFFFFLLFIFLGDRYLHLSIHFYRLLTIFFLSIPLMLINFVKRRDKIVSTIIAFGCLYLIFTHSSLVHPEGVIDFPKLEPIGQLDGRMLVIASPRNQASPHVMQFLAPLTSKNHAIKGLFVESSPNALFLFALERQFDRNNFVWGLPFFPAGIIDNQRDYQNIMVPQLKLFNINHVLSFYQAEPSWQREQRVSFFNAHRLGEVKRYFYDLYRVTDSSLIDVLDYKPELISPGDWEMLNWFLSENVSRVRVKENVPDNVGTGTENVEILEVSQRQDYLRFSVDSDKDVPVLIKISEFPNWKAYANGEPIKIYKAAPYLMLVYGHGVIELKYEYIAWDYLAMSLTLLGLIIVGFSLLKKNHLTGFMNKLTTKYIRKYTRKEWLQKWKKF